MPRVAGRHARSCHPCHHVGGTRSRRGPQRKACNEGRQIMATHAQRSPKRGQPNRLESGGLIDRSRVIRFKFDGRTYAGHQGDNLASSLLANDVLLVGRSFKYHRPRGILSAGSEDPNALVELRDGARREPNTRATVAELFDGLSATSQNRWPSLNFDLMSVNSLLSP